MTYMQIFLVFLVLCLKISSFFFLQKSDVKIYLYTAVNPSEGHQTDISDPLDLNLSNFSPNKDTFIYIHGYTDHVASDKTAQKIKNALLSKNDVNVFLVDWSKISDNFLYGYVVLEIESVAKILSSLINQYVRIGGLDLNRTTICGHSLGAQLAGATGTALGGKINQAVGLDPASILFFPFLTTNRITQSSAQFVEVIHTNGYFNGYYWQSGHADFYVNGGVTQPKCGLDLGWHCSHVIAIDYYTESLLTGNFIARKCKNYNRYKKGKCNKEATAFMGDYILDRKAKGIYFINTNEEPPFAKG